jgi:signal transduction histidine kinase
MHADPPSTRTKLVNNIRNSTQTMVQRLEELLELARVSRGTFKLNIQPVELTPFLSKVIASFEPYLQKDRIHLTTLLPETTALVDLDASRIEQVLTNLLSNACKYSQPGGRIQLKASLDNSLLRVDVSDEGRGIPLEAQKDLFRPYHRVEQDRKIPGLGLGLAVCKQIVDAHSGNIWVESESGKGSTFSFSIPVKLIEGTHQAKSNTQR